MPIENPLPPFWEWLKGDPSRFLTDPTALGAGLSWLVIVGVLTLAGVVIGGLVVILRYGPSKGLAVTWRVLAQAPADLFRMSPRRVWALTWLSVKDAFRRKIVVVFGVFVVLFLFAGWFLDSGNINPARLYLTFVLSAPTYLVLLLALLLSAFSIPNELRTRTLHTIVTKPVRASEIVLGRILGFTLVGTGFLAAMALISYVFVVRGLDHTHEVDALELKAVSATADGNVTGFAGRTKPSQRHTHRIVVAPKKDPKTGETQRVAQIEPERGHTHDVKIDSSSGEDVYVLGAPEGMLVARVPVYGSLRFRDKDGVDTEKGINVGDEWTYRSFVQGNSKARAIWTFEGITPERFPDGLPLESTIEVFRTYKGDIVTGVHGSISLRNPRTGLTVEAYMFNARDFVTTEMFIKRQIDNIAGRNAKMVSRQYVTPEGMTYDPPQNMLDSKLAQKEHLDLFEDLVADGRVEVWLNCLDNSQYFGASQADLYVRADNAPFWLNFFKGYLGVWLQMLLVIGFGVMFSTFLNGPVAMVATAGALIASVFREQLIKLTQSPIGGGPFESLVRMLKQDNMITELPGGFQTDLVKFADQYLCAPVMMAAKSILPPLADFSYTDWVAYGFDINWDPLIVIPLVHTFAILVPMFVVGYFFLKTREVAR
jgi:ABC-type transport system involved in multi-copper enzyme maturation permease subunit